MGYSGDPGDPAVEPVQTRRKCRAFRLPLLFRDLIERLPFIFRFCFSQRVHVATYYRACNNVTSKVREIVPVEGRTWNERCTQSLTELNMTDVQVNPSKDDAGSAVRQNGDVTQRTGWCLLRGRLFSLAICRTRKHGDAHWRRTRFAILLNALSEYRVFLPRSLEHI